jgi:hypothetical protein
LRFTITINEVEEETGVEIPRYQQTVDHIDIHAVINAVNNSPPGRQRALRSDAGKPRRPVAEETTLP